MPNFQTAKNMLAPQGNQLNVNVYNCVYTHAHIPLRQKHIYIYFITYDVSTGGGHAPIHLPPKPYNPLSCHKIDKVFIFE